MPDPRVSVILPVHNGAAYVAEAVCSILEQTMRDLELIVIDDGSTDATYEVIARIVDPRLTVTRQQNAGLSVTLNRALARCRGTYVARQDHDDVSQPTRLARQVSYLDAHPTCGLLGTGADIFVGRRPSGRSHAHPLGDRALRFMLLFDTPFVHSSVMLPKRVLDAVGGYSADPARQPEDYDLWSRVAARYQVANLPERLVIYRELPTSLSRVSDRPFARTMVHQNARHLAACLGAAVPTPAMVDAAALMHGVFDMLSPHPDLAEIMALLRGAAARLDPGGEDRELDGVLARHLRQVRRRYYLRRRLPRFVAGIVRAVRRRRNA